MEMFKEIQGFNGVYQVSNYGNIRSFSKYCKNGKILKLEKTSRGYLRISLKRKHYSVYRLVAFHFLPTPSEGLVVNHKDGCKENNSVSNLEWVTQKENVLHSFKNGTSKVFKGTHNACSKKIIKKDMNDKTIEIIKGLREYCKVNNLDRSCIQRVLNGKYKSAYGYKWEIENQQMN